MTKITFKTLADAVKHVGGDANAIAILSRHVNTKTRDKGKRELVKGLLTSVASDPALKAKLEALGIKL